MKGLYMSLEDRGHSYGIQAIDDPIAYDKLLALFYANDNQYQWFKQGDSATTFTSDGNKSWLYIEFLGMDLDDDSALKLCELIALQLRIPLIGIL